MAFGRKGILRFAAGKVLHFCHFIFSAEFWALVIPLARIMCHTKSFLSVAPALWSLAFVSEEYPFLER